MRSSYEANTEFSGPNYGTQIGQFNSNGEDVWVSITTLLTGA